MDLSQVDSGQEAVPTTRSFASASPPQALKTYHPYAASLYDVPFMRPPNPFPDSKSSHKDESVDKPELASQREMNNAFKTLSSPSEPSPTQKIHPGDPGGCRREGRLTSHEAQQPRDTASPTPALTAYGGLAVPHSRQSPYTYGLPQCFAPTLRPVESGTQNMLQSERERYLALDGGHDNYPISSTRHRRRRPLPNPSKPTPTALLALDGATAPPSRLPPYHQANPLIDPALTSTPSIPASKPTSLPPGPFACHACSQSATYQPPGKFGTQDEVLMHMHTQHNMPHSRLCCCEVCRFVFWELEGDEKAKEEGVKWLRGGGFGEVGMGDSDAAGAGEVGGSFKNGQQYTSDGKARAEDLAGRLRAERTEGWMGVGEAVWDGSFDEFVDFGTGDEGLQFGSGDGSGGARAGDAPDAPGWLDQPT
ncbi:hypothetical protein LTR95_006838 [Oleoguttula sp. CCFEE 5521]